ncbi:MAG: hypothetical protein AB1507_05965 [Bacillota bacterium]|nr:hypothetical protein [Thermoanaerobacteraceae bacterium]
MRGFLLKKKDGTGIVLTRDGLFMQGMVGEAEVIGEEVAVQPIVKRRFPSWMAMAAVVLACVGFGVYRLAFPPAFAYVAVDVEPSVELALDSRLAVIEQRGFNASGKRLLALEDVRGKPLEAAVSGLLERAFTEGYLRDGRDHVVLVAVTVRGEEERLDTETLACLVARDFPAVRGGLEIVAVQADWRTRWEAARNNLSTGRYLLQRELEAQGLGVVPGFLREESLRQLEEKQGVTVATLVGDEGSVLVRLGEGLSGTETGQGSFFAAPVPGDWLGRRK